MANPGPLAAADPAGGLGRDAALTGGSSVAATAVAALTSILIARYLGVTARGEWAVISSIALLLGTVLSLGLPAAAAYAAARTREDERARILSAAIRGGCALALIAALLFMGIVLLSRPGSSTDLALVLGAAMAAGGLVHLVVQNCLLTAVALRWFAVVQLLPAALMLVGVVVLEAATGLTVAAVVAISAGTSAVGALAGVVLLRRRGILRSSGAPSSRGELIRTLRPYVAFALLTFAITSLTQVVQRADVLIVDGYRGAREAGLYAVAVQFASVLLVLPGGIGLLLFRRGARSTPGHWDDALRALGWVALVSVAGAAFIAVSAPELIDILVGERYGEAATALRWLLPGMVLLGLQSLVSSYVASRGRPRSVLVAWVTGAVLQVTLNFLVVPAHGFEGAAVVGSLAYMVVLGLHVRPFLDLRPAASSGAG